MIRIVTLFTVLAFLSACGGSNYSSNRAVKTQSNGYSSSQRLFARGPIFSACQQAGRKQASRSRCGCVQAVADRHLSSAQQRKGARFFADPQKAQDLRQSGRAADSAFWKKWKAYGKAAGRQCS